MSQPRPVSPQALPDLLADLFVAAAAGSRIRVAVDGALAACPRVLADALAGPLAERGAQPLRVSTQDFLRPASLRWEYGRTDPDSYYLSWVDVGALKREVLQPLAPGGRGRWLPSLWDARVDRATRAEYRTAGQRAVLLLDGEFLLGNGLDFDLAVHLHLSPAALARRTPLDLAWTLPAHARYAAEVQPLSRADVIIRYDDPRRPAIELGATR